jgi:hypothetical protein
VEVLVDGAPIGPPVVLPTVSDSYTPQWGPLPIRVTLDDRVRVMVTLEDVDVGEAVGIGTNDPIGTIEIVPEDLRKAFAAGTTYQLPCYARGDRLILYLALQVRPA